MENLWETTPFENVLIILFMFCAFVAFALFLFAIVLTVSAVLGHYSRAAIVLYWTHAFISLVLYWCDCTFTALLLFVYLSPLIALCMHRLSRRHKSKIALTSNWNNT